MSRMSEAVAAPGSGVIGAPGAPRATGAPGDACGVATADAPEDTTARFREPGDACGVAIADDWLALTEQAIDPAALCAWVVRPAAGAVVLFSGTVRDHAEHRTGVTRIDYEAYESQVLPRLASIAAELRRRWPETVRVAVVHRCGIVELTETSVAVAVSAPHRAEAFEAARFAIDTLKATVPIWKRETHDAGTDWGLAAQPITEAAAR